MGDLISRQAAIDAIERAKTARSPEGEIYVAKINAQMNIQALPYAEPEKVLVAEVKLSKEQIQDAVDKAVEKMKAELEPCDFCKHKDDCGYMSMYCPAERRTDG